MRENLITEHFPKIIKDYMVTSFTGQKLDQTFGDQYWEFTDEGGLMKVLEAICDVVEDAIKERDDEIEQLKSRIERYGETSCDLPVIAEPIAPLSPSAIYLAPSPPQSEPKKRAPRADKGKSRKKCVACEGSGKNTKGEDCPICTKTGLIEAVLDGQPPFETPPAPPVIGGPIPPGLQKGLLEDHENFKREVVNQWEEKDAATAAPVFFAPPPPPPYWNPNV